MRCSGPRGPGGVRLRGPLPPNPRGPGASEPPAGLGAAKLEGPTCPAPAQCPNPLEALDIPERADEPQAGTQTDTQTLARTHAKGDKLACASSSARARAPGR